MSDNLHTLENAVDLCNRAGMRYISYGKKLSKGEIVDETEVKHDMFLLYLEAAQSGLGRALYNVGVCYQFGIGVGIDIAEAVSYYEQAINNGNTQAYMYLAKIYMQGALGTPDKAKADELISQAAEKGNPTACFMLGGKEANAKNSEKALSYFVKAADKHAEYSYCTSMTDAQSGLDYESARDGVGNALAKCLFFSAYLTLLVLRKKSDFVKAFNWLKIAFEEMQMPEASIVLAHCYTYGEGVSQDFEEAERYVKIAENFKIHGAEDARDDLEEVQARKNATKK